MSEPLHNPCPSHPDMTVVDACQRCGGFVCLRCKQADPHFCPKCTKRQKPFLFHRDNLQLLDLLSASWNDVFKRHWVELSFAAFLALFIPSIVSSVLQLPILLFPPLMANMQDAPSVVAAVALLGIFGILASAVQILLQFILQRGATEMTHMAWNGQPITFKPLVNLKAGFKAVLASLLISIPWLVLVGLGVGATFGILAMQKAGALPSPLFLGLGVLVFVALAVALLIWFLPLFLLLQPFAENPHTGIMEAIRLCFERGRGFRMQIFLQALISWFLSMLGLIAFCIGIIPAVALILTYQTGLWKALSTEGPNSTSSIVPNQEKPSQAFWSAS